MQGTLPKSVPGQLAAAAVPAQRLTDYVGAAPSCAHAHAQQGTPIPPGHCQAIDLSNMIQTAKQPAVQSQGQKRCIELLQCFALQADSISIAKNELVVGQLVMLP